MISRLLINFILGGLLTVSLRYFYGYFWFLASPFNMDWLEHLFRREEYASEYPFNSYSVCSIFILLSFIPQIIIPFACVVLKWILTSQLSILDSTIVCTIPALYFLSLLLLELWVDFSSEQKSEPFASDLIAEGRLKGQLEFAFKRYYIKDFIATGGLLMICLSGGGIGYLTMNQMI